MHKLTTAAPNSSTISRRRNRNTAINHNFDDSHDENGTETAENFRNRDRFRDRSGRKQLQQFRSRGRNLHKIEDDEDEEDDDNINSSDDTLDDDYENEVSDRYNHPSSSRNYLAASIDHVVGAAVPRKARSGMKRSNGSRSSGIGMVREDNLSRQSSASPSRMSPAHQVSTSSNASARKKLKPASGGKFRPPKTSKPPVASLVQDELEVAEVLFGLTRQFQVSAKPEEQKCDDEFRNESKSGAVSPDSNIVGNYSVVPQSNLMNQMPIAPKRKRPRKVEEESPASSSGGMSSLQNTSISFADKMDQEKQPKTEAASSPKSEKKNAAVSSNLSVLMDEDVKFTEPTEKTEKDADLKPSIMKSEQLERKAESISIVKEHTSFNLGSSVGEETTAKSSVLKNKSTDVKFTIDLMALPSEKLSIDEENDLCIQESDQKATDAVKIEMEKKDKQKLDGSLAERNGDKSLEESDSKCQKGKEIINKLLIDLERVDKDSIDGIKVHVQNPPKALDLESKQQYKSAQNASPLAPPSVSGWQGNFPPFGYNGHVPPVQVVPPDSSSGSSTIFQTPGFVSPQPRPKRCATHCYIAQKIRYHQQLIRANPIWSAAAAAAAVGTIPLYGAKQLGPNAIPPSDAALFGNAVQGNFLAMNVSSSKDKHEPSRATVSGQSAKEIPAAGNAIIEGIEKKQFVVPQFLQSVSGPNMLPCPTFLFPVNQQQDVTSLATAVTGASKSTVPNGNSAQASASTSMNLSFAGLATNEAQYLAIVQNGGYPFPMAANLASASQQYRGLTPAGPIPFFNSPFYPSQVLHPSQMQQQQAMSSHPVPPQQAYLSANNSIGPCSSKHPQSQQTSGAGATAGSSHGPAENEKGSSSNQAQKNSYGQKFAMPISHQNLMPTSTINPSAIGGGGPAAQTDKQSWSQHQTQTQQKQSGRVEISSSQVFAMPFSGVASLPPGLDFSSMAQSGMFLQNLPESFRHPYNHLNIPASSATAYEAQQKTQNHNSEEGSSVSKEVRSANGKSEDDGRKPPSTSGKTIGTGSRHNLTFCRTDEPAMSSILNNNAVDSSSRTLNLMTNHSAPSTIATTASATSTINLSSSQQQLIQLQKMQPKQLSMQNQYPSSHSKISSSNNSSTMYNERLPPGLHGAKFSQPLAGFPQTVVQGGNNGSSSTQSPQWKVNVRPATVPPGTAASQSAVKNNVLQQQGRAAQSPTPSPSHQNLMSFGANMMKTAPAGLQQHSMQTSSQSSANMINTPHNSGLKGSPISTSASCSVKPGTSSSVVSMPQQSPSPKISSSNSNQKSSSPLGSREPVAVNSQRNATTTSNSGTRLQQLPQQMPQQPQKQPQHSQTQIIFANGFMPQAQYAQPNIAARFYQPRPPEQSQQQNSPGGSTVVTESAAAVSGNSSGGLPSPGLMHAAQLAVASRASSLVPATFSYLTAPAVSVKATADQNPAVRPEKKTASGKR